MTSGDRQLADHDLGWPATATLVGRSREIETLTRRLDEERPALVVVSGEDGMGKTRLLAALEQLAHERDWTAARCLRDRLLRVTPSTSPRDFIHEVHAVLDAPLEHAESVWSQPEGGAGDVRLLAHLARRAPVVLMLDGFRPSPRFRAWWDRHFLSGVKGTDAAIVIVIADRPEAMSTLALQADDIVKLGPLDRGELDEWFADFGLGLDPVLSDEERAAYVEASAEAPDLFLPLARSLAAAADPPGGERP